MQVLLVHDLQMATGALQATKAHIAQDQMNRI